jgi:hypothetical protein
MKTFLNTILAASCANILTFLIYQGFINSYWGRNIREEISRWFDSMSKHMRKLKKENQ